MIGQTTDVKVWVIEGRTTKAIQNKSENKIQKQAHKEKGHVGRYNCITVISSNMPFLQPFP